MRVYEGEVRLPRMSLRSSGLRLPRDVDQSSTSVAPGCPGAAVLHNADTGFADAVPRSRRAFRASFIERPALERQRAQCDPKRDAGDPQERAQGKPGARCTRGLMCHDAHSKTHTSIQVQRKQSGLPCAMVLTAYAALSSATNSSCRRHRRIRGFAEPGWVQKTSADLTPATGARTTRFCRPRAACAKAFDGFGTHPPKFWRRRFQHRSSARRLGLTGLATCPARALRARRRRVHRIPSQRS